MRSVIALAVLTTSCGAEPSTTPELPDTGASVDDTSTTPADTDTPADTQVDGDERPDAAGDASTDAPPPASSGPIGWASVAGYGVTTTTGGGSATPVVVKTLEELETQAAGLVPRVIRVSGEISGRIRIGSNKTIEGLPGAKLRGTILLDRSVNVILRRLTIVGFNCSDVTDCQNGADAIAVRGGAHHLWFDHLDVSDGSDGNLDITQASDLVTVSWTKFSYSPTRAPTSSGNPHRFSNLIGADDADTADKDKLRVTFHHVWWADHVSERMPRVRFGKVHVFNSLYTSSGNSYCVGGGVFANVLTENNVFVSVRNPIRVSGISNEATIVVSKGNVYESITGTTADKGGPAFEPPYPYTLEPAATVKATVMAGAKP